tara:strand:+ start:10504 stop:10947 length:444 start_codon:yes stop_codon:yes gene_type:complete
MANVYNRGKLAVTNGTLGATGWSTGGADVGVLLVGAGYVYDPDHNFVSDLSNELAGGGYARVTALGGRTITEDDANDRVGYDALDATFTTLGAGAGTPTQAIVFNNTPGVDTAKELIARIPLTAPPLPNGGDYTIQWDASGVFRLDD